VAKPDVIAAIATGPGRGAIGIVRLSGPDLSSTALELLGKALQPRYATPTHFLDARGEPLDSGIAIYFPGPRSYTGEDVLELQGHGGGAVLKAVLRRCVEVGARLAEPGEFTRRAFLNGKIDLAQAESVADLIDAGSEAAARAAVRSLNGALSVAVHTVSEELLELRIRLEAGIDFPEEEVDQLQPEMYQAALAEIAAKARDLLSKMEQGARLREGLKVAIVGAPNVGKSTLLNHLAGETLAIVTDVPGTTRDIITADLTIQGVPVTFLDTAGIRATQDPVEEIGVSRAREAAAKADLVLDVRDLSKANGAQNSSSLPAGVRTIVVYNKVDLVPKRGVETANGLCVSAKTGEGMGELRRSILASSGWDHASEEVVFIARERHMLALIRAVQHIEAASKQTGPVELVAEDLRLAGAELGKIQGVLAADDLLGEIFSRFCIGK
jgi:tRNA modification GTPase